MSKTIEEMIEVMRAYERGEMIELSPKKTDCNVWVDVVHPYWNWRACDYRVKAVNDEIDWSHVAPEFKWMTRDKDGTAYISDEKPDCGDSVWFNDGDYHPVKVFASYKRGTVDWKDSLVERPT